MTATCFSLYLQLGEIPKKLNKIIINASIFFIKVIHVSSIKMVNIHFSQVNFQGQSTLDCPEIGVAEAMKCLPPV